MSSKFRTEGREPSLPRERERLDFSCVYVQMRVTGSLQSVKLESVNARA